MKTDIERFTKWTKCWGRYRVELDATHKGVVLEGEWLNGNQHGQGTATFANGDKYVGEFKDGKVHGQGIFTFADGRRVEGIFENGKFIREAKINLPNLNNNIAANTNRTDIDRERQQLAEERRRLEEDKRQREQQRRSQRLHLTVSNTQPAADGSFTINVQTNADTASLKINGNEEGGSQDGRYAIKLVARAGQPTTFNITATQTLRPSPSAGKWLNQKPATLY